MTAQERRRGVCVGVGDHDSIGSKVLTPGYLSVYMRVYVCTCGFYLYYLANFARHGTARHANATGLG